MSTFRIEIIGADVLMESAASVMTSDPIHTVPDLLAFGWHMGAPREFDILP
ncbi:hypothetical protein GCM10027167_68520 [Nocardia heshunensis]